MLRGFGKGMGATIARELPAFACYFGSYDYTLKILSFHPRDEYATCKVLFAGGMAGVNSWVLLGFSNAVMYYCSIRVCSC